MPIADIEEGLEEIRNGRMVILVNEESPESDGFFCIPAEQATAENINHMLRYGRGVIYLALTEERIRELGIVLIPPENSTFAGIKMLLGRDPKKDYGDKTADVPLS